MVNGYNLVNWKNRDLPVITWRWGPATARGGSWCRCVRGEEFPKLHFTTAPNVAVCRCSVTYVRSGVDGESPASRRWPRPPTAVWWTRGYAGVADRWGHGVGAGSLRKARPWRREWGEMGRRGNKIVGSQWRTRPKRRLMIFPISVLHFLFYFLFQIPL
jgi:hypothetical protein